MSSVNTTGVALGLLLIFAASRLQKFIRGLQAVNHVHGMRLAIAPLSLLGAMLPTSWWNPGMGFSWAWRETNFDTYRRDIISAVPYMLGTPMLYVGSAGMSKQLLATENKNNLEKPKEMSLGLLLWGESAISANGDMWRNHRRILASSFTPAMYSLVLEQTKSVYNEMVEAEGWSDKKEVIVDNFNRLPVKFTFTVIARCGFGLDLPWKLEADHQRSGMEDGHAVGEALQFVSETSLLRLAFPNWVYKLPIPWLHHFDSIWKFLANFMKDSISAKREELASTDPSSRDQAADVFTRLVAAGGEGKSSVLDDSEIMGNTFALMFAGHETTAHVLSATLTFLGIYQDLQEKALNEIVSVLGTDRPPTLDDLRNLPFVLACFYECIRLFPSGVLLPRKTTEDVVVTAQRPKDTTVKINKGTTIIFDMIGIHHNPNDFPDPNKFNPSRWEGVGEQDVSMFGFGPRACIGRKFSQTEALAFLAIFLREWKVDIILEKGESRDDYAKKVLKRAKHLGMTFGIDTVKLKLIRRSD